MDIERLKELQGLVALNTWMSERAKKELLTLIDEAIARQSVKSEEVAEAISWVTNTRHSNQYMSGNWTAPMKNHINRAIQDTIITALQAYQPWISVEDRLPESDDGHQNLVLVLDIGGNYEIEMPSHIIRNIEDYTHWKSLPEPPKGE